LASATAKDREEADRMREASGSNPDGSKTFLFKKKTKKKSFIKRKGICLTQIQKKIIGSEGLIRAGKAPLCSNPDGSGPLLPLSFLLFS
jgi:hypothetical protein